MRAKPAPCSMNRTNTRAGRLARPRRINARRVSFLQRLNLNPEEVIEIDLEADEIQAPNHLVGEPVAVADQPEDVPVDNCSSLISSTEDEAPQVFPVFYSPRTSLPTAAILEVTRRYETEAV